MKETPFPFSQLLHSTRNGTALFPLLFLFLPPLLSQLSAQPFSGNWTGLLTQDGKDDGYLYSIILEQDGDKVFGEAKSQKADGSSKAKFEIGGIWDGEILTLQEVEQLEPPDARWCLKHIRLKPVVEDSLVKLKGYWEAEGCTPGYLELTSRPADFGTEEHDPVFGGNGNENVGNNANGHGNAPPRQQPKATIAGPPGKPLPSPVYGKYTGHLSQADRDYGFYFELILKEDGTGVSQIISDGEGGNATHELNWIFDKNRNELHFEETAILKKSVTDWPWCIKSAKLDFRRETDRLSLTGKWNGFIEGFTPKSGSCAPGTLYLERPIFKTNEVIMVTNGGKRQIKPVGVRQYEKKQKREVNVDRVLVVKSTTVRVRVWDNGTIDGDKLSLFVNGKMILKNYRATRRKHETIVELDNTTNYLILHALNLGDISPNTVAVSVDDGFEEQVVIMSSNLDKSGAIMIKQFTVGEK
ncbi:MAG TPA: hypothetical protein ENJ95_17350 [Bacteroidetes bacterium]|nr:hypothetical protein [Bacteroidota bacterium]